jgi:hypothetical protein
MRHKLSMLPALRFNKAPDLLENAPIYIYRVDAMPFGQIAFVVGNNARDDWRWHRDGIEDEIGYPSATDALTALQEAI